jgi:biopolymer transport protein ExbB/TolQ
MPRPAEPFTVAAVEFNPALFDFDGNLTRALEVIREAAERELADQVLHLENDMVMLATITNIAPFLGLLGTVWGVMDAFNGDIVDVKV